jgi:hypothetical protein
LFRVSRSVRRSSPRRGRRTQQMPHQNIELSSLGAP